MKLSAKEVDAIVVLSLNGSVMGGPDASALNDELHKLVAKKKKKVVLDLSGVQSMNSSGLGMLIGALTTMKNAGGELKIAAPSSKIENLLVITKLTTVFELYPSVKKAVESFAK
ncbi:MAG: STAS domain-containing protein [Bacteroidota bacterium]